MQGWSEKLSLIPWVFYFGDWKWRSEPGGTHEGAIEAG